MRPVPNQPILFTSGADDLPQCCLENRYQARMFDSDSIGWQFQVNLCEGATQVVQNPFFNVVSDWTFNDGSQYWFGGTASALLVVGSSIEQTGITTTTSQWYLMKVVVVESSDASGVINITGLAQNYEIPNTVGPTEIYVQANSASTDLLVEYVGEGSGFNNLVRISQITLTEVDYPVCTIRQTDGTLIESPTNSFRFQNFVSYSYAPTSTAIDIGEFIIRVERTCGSTTETWESECIKILDEDDCTLQIGYCGNNNYQGPSYLPYARVVGEIMRATGYSYPNRYTYQNSAGVFNNGYTRRNKHHTLKVELCPEHIRDFIYALSFANEIAIKEGTSDQREYFLDEEPDDPVFPDGEKELATITMRLVEKDQNQYSTFGGGCSVFLPPVVIGRADIQEAIQTAPDELIKG